MWHKALWKGHPMRRELTRVGLLAELANHYTTRGASKWDTMAWIDYKKANDMVLQYWIIDCLKLYKIFDEVINLIEKNMKNWKVELIGGGKSLPEMNIPRGIFQGDALSRLLL